MKNTLEPLVAKMKDQVIEWRRYLHANPELSFQEKETSQFVFDTLCSFDNLEVTRPTEFSVMARLVGSQPGKVLGMRADMDALPIQEETDYEFSSKKSGVMHACGHDGHTAMLLGTAKILSGLKDQLKGEIRFFFQHAEELPPGGAQEMVDAGVMDGVDRVIGAHLLSNVEVGTVAVGYGPMTSAPDSFSIKIQGKGGHGAMPQETIDSIAIGAQVVTNLQQIVSRNTDSRESLVVTVGTFNGGTAGNIIADAVTLSGTVRSFKESVRQTAPELMERIVKGVTEAHGASYEIDYSFGYRPIYNDESVTAVIEHTMRDVYTDERVVIMDAITAGEDFSAFLTKAPGSFFFVGAGNKENGIIYPHHHPKFAIDEDSLQYGVGTFVNAAFNLQD